MNKTTILNKSFYENGKILGKSCAKYLRERLRLIDSKIKKTTYKQSELQAGINDFTAVLKKVVPHWLEEAKGIADGARIPVDKLLLLNCLPHDFFKQAGMNCTSIVQAGKIHNLLFKIRDERNWVQQQVIKQSPGIQCVQYGVDIGNLGVAHFVNSSGIAGGNNTGSNSSGINNDPVLNDCHITRFLAEQCKKVDDAPKALEKLMELKVMGGAAKDRGSIYLLAGREKCLVLECNSEDYAKKEISKGCYTISNHYQLPKAEKWQTEPANLNTRRRKQRIEELVSGVSGELSVNDLIRFSRDRKYHPNCMCNDNKIHFWMTISVWITVIPKDDPADTVSYCCCGNSRNSFYIPLSISQRENPEILLNGDFYAASNRLYEANGCGKHLEKLQRKFESGITDQENPDSYVHDTFRAYQLLRSGIK